MVEPPDLSGSTALWNFVTPQPDKRKVNNELSIVKLRGRKLAFCTNLNSTGMKTLDREFLLEGLSAMLLSVEDMESGP